MSESQTGVLIELLETIADNKYVMGDHLVEIGVSGPNLEATVSSIALAQAELGHARLLYNWVEELKTGSKKKINITGQTGKAFQSTADNTTDWISLIANLFITNITSKVILDAVASSEFSTKTITKMVREQEDNIIYARSWSNQLLADKGQIPVKFEKDYIKAKEEAYQWLSQWEQDQRIRDAKIVREGQSLLAGFEEETSQISLEEDVVAN